MCFLLLTDDKKLVKGTMTVVERLQRRVAKNESTTDLESSDTGQKPNKRAAKKRSLAAIQCRKFAGSDFKILKLEYLSESFYSDSIIGATSYQLHPRSNFSAVYVNDKRPLLMEQCQTISESEVFAIVALRKHRAEKPQQI